MNPNNKVEGPSDKMTKLERRVFVLGMMTLFILGPSSTIYIIKNEQAKKTKQAYYDAMENTDTAQNIAKKVVSLNKALETCEEYERAKKDRDNCLYGMGVGCASFFAECIQAFRCRRLRKRLTR